MNISVSQKSIRSVALILLALTFYLVGRVPRTYALYDPREVPNNIHGIHILNIDEIGKAAELVNATGGKWGYVTIPIQASDRDKEKWSIFMTRAKELNLIPILRITTIPQGGTWAAGELTDLVDFANFLNELPWPIENRYVIIFNEVNRSLEWGDTVSPEKYAHILKNSYTIFKERSEDFFILPAGLDLALNDTSTSLSARNYFNRMQQEIPEIWSYIDGWNSHSYPNPAFSSSPYKTGWTSIQGYVAEVYFTNNKDKPIFITETGWDNTLIEETVLVNYYISAYQIWGRSEDVVAITPFLLDARDGPFTKFSLINPDASESLVYKSLKAFPKSEGVPILTESTQQPEYRASSFASISPNYRTSFVYVLENFFRSVFNLPKIHLLDINNRQFTVEVAESAEHLTRGLSGRKNLKEDEGMLFILPEVEVPRFWMKDMRFPIDIIWIRDGKIIDISADVPTPTSDDLAIYSPKEESDMVLELNAGVADKLGINIGDKITLFE